MRRTTSLRALMRRHVLVVAVLGLPTASWADSTATVYQVQTVAGSCPIAGGVATAQQLGTVTGIAVDAAGNIYFSDTDNHLVRKINPAGIVTTLAGTCYAGYSGDGGPAASAQLNQPYGVALDSAGDIYIADYGNNRVRRIATDGTISTVAGNGQAGQAGDGGPAVNAQLLAPRNVVLDAAGNLYISEFEGHRVRQVAPDGTISTFAGTGIAGYSGDSGLATEAQLDFPAGLAVDSAGALYIADSGNDCIRKIQGGIIGTVVGAEASTPVPLSNAVGVAVGAGGIIYIAGEDGSGSFNPSTRVWTPILQAAWDLALNPSGNLYLALDSIGGEIYNQSTNQVIAGGAPGIGDGGPAIDAQVAPSAVALDATGDLLIADQGNYRIRMVNAAGVIETSAGTVAPGATIENASVCAGDGGPATAAQLKPAGIAVDYLNRVLVADLDCNKVRMIGANGQINAIAGCGNYDVVQNPQCTGLGVEGMPAAQMPLSGPRGLCTDNSGTVFIVDTGNNRVLKVAQGAGVVTAAGNGSPGYSGDGYLAPLAQLQTPFACAVDSSGDLFIADAGNNSIREVTPDGNISTVAGTGEAGFSGDGGPATSAALNGPQGIGVDSSGDLFISDTNNQRIRELTPDGVIQTVAAPGASSPLTAPMGSTPDSAGNLYFADIKRVRMLTPETAASSQPSQPSISAVNAANLQAGAVAPGELISLLGAGLGPQTGASGSPDSAGLIPTSLAGTTVQFDGNAAPVLYAQAGQVNVQVPYSVAGEATTNLVISYNGQQVGTLQLQVVSSAPGIFPAITNQDGSVNSQSQPAPQNSIITLYATGTGLTAGANVTGQPASSPYAPPEGSVTLTVAGVAAQILFAGSAPGLVGTLQINARLPGGFVPSGSASVVLTVGGAASPPATVWLQ